MEFWILILTLWAFYRWVQSRIRRKREGERFARVIDSLNRLEAKQERFNSFEARVQELERRLVSPSTSSAPETSAVTPPPAPPLAHKPVDTPIPTKIPPWPEV